MDIVNKSNIIGRTALIIVEGIHNVPAKVDTGADSSSIWASDISNDNGVLSFKLFDTVSPYYTGNVITKNEDEYAEVRIASSSGQREMRYSVDLKIVVEGRTFSTRFTLADRTTMMYPVLLGRRFVDHNFLVDTTRDIDPALQNELLVAKKKRRDALLDTQ